MDLDEFLAQVGDWDKYQYLLLSLVCLPMCIPCGVQGFVQLFTAMTPDHWCKVPALIQSNLTVDQRKNLSIPFMNDRYSQCSYYDLDYSEILLGNLPTNISETPVKSCDQGWEYNLEEVESSVVIDFDLVCSDAIMPTVALALLNIGGFIGSFLFGYINDRLGRKRSYFICLTLQIIAGLVSGLVPEFVSWSIARLVLGLCVPAILHIPFVICLEVVAPAKRTLVSFLSNMFYVLGLVIISGLAYVIRDWRSLYYVTSVPFVLFYLYLLFLPESLRWLLSAGDVDQVVTALKKIAAVNSREPSEEAWRTFKDTALKEHDASKKLRNGSRAEVRDLFRTPNMRIKTVIIVFTWVVNETVYVGLSYYGPSMGSDPYMSFFLSCVVEIPGYLACYLLMDRLGRRILLSVCMFVSGISSVATVLVSPDAMITTLILYLIAKLTIAGGTMIIFQYAGELYPTEVRGVGIGFAGYLGGLGTGAIPFINYLGSQWLVLPIVIMGLLCLLGGVATLRLPETLNERLPQTLEEGENFGKDFPWFWSLIPSFLKSRKSQNQDNQNIDLDNCTGIDAPPELLKED